MHLQYIKAKEFCQLKKGFISPFKINNQLITPNLISNKLEQKGYIALSVYHLSKEKNTS
jgi:hypothetical protein